MKDSCASRSSGGSIGRDGVFTGFRWSRRPRPPRVTRGGRQASGAMTTTRGTRVLATAVVLLVVLAACSEDEAAPSASPSTPTPMTAATTRPPTDSDVAATTATELMVTYFATVDQLNQDPSTPIRSLKKVATSVQLTALQRSISNRRRDGEHQTGSTMIADSEVQTVSLDNSDPKAGKVPTVFIDVCWDVSNVDVVDKDGKSVVAPTRPDTGWTRYTVANYEWSKDPDGAWRVAGGEDLEKSPCTPAA